MREESPPMTEDEDIGEMQTFTHDDQAATRDPRPHTPTSPTMTLTEDYSRITADGPLSPWSLCIRKVVELDPRTAEVLLDM
jgi:hypothetical protein